MRDGYPTPPTTPQHGDEESLPPLFADMSGEYVPSTPNALGLHYGGQQYSQGQPLYWAPPVSMTGGHGYLVIDHSDTSFLAPADQLWHARQNPDFVQGGGQVYYSPSPVSPSSYPSQVAVGSIGSGSSSRRWSPSASSSSSGTVTSGGIPAHGRYGGVRIREDEEDDEDGVGRTRSRKRVREGGSRVGPYEPYRGSRGGWGHDPGGSSGSSTLRGGSSYPYHYR